MKPIVFTLALIISSSTANAQLAGPLIAGAIASGGVGSYQEQFVATSTAFDKCKKAKTHEVAKQWQKGAFKGEQREAELLAMGHRKGLILANGQRKRLKAKCANNIIKLENLQN